MARNRIILGRLEQWQLDDIIKKHNNFLSGKPGGARAVVKDKDLSGLNFMRANLPQSDFTGCIMSNCDLSASNFESSTLFGCEFSGSNLKNANFSRTDLRGADIESADLTDINLTGADLREGDTIIKRKAPPETQDDPYAPVPPSKVNFSGSTLSNAQLSGVTATNADFSDTVLTGTNLKGADLRQANFHTADLSFSNMADVDLRDANLSSAVLLGIEMDTISEIGGADMTLTLTDENAHEKFDDIDLTLDEIIERHIRWVASAGREGVRMNISEYDMRNVGNMTDMRLTAIRATETTFAGLDLSHSELQSAKFDRSDLRKCILNETDLRGASFKGAMLNWAHIQNAQLSVLRFHKKDGSEHDLPCDFSNASMHGINFTASQLNHAVFKGAYLVSADFTDCDLRHADFRGANLKRSNFTNTLTKGALFDDGINPDELRPHQIPSLN